MKLRVLIENKLFISISFFLTLFLLSGFFIFYRWNSLPQNLTRDEIEFTKLALSLDGKPYIPFSRLADGHGTIYFYIILAFFKIMGVSQLSLRLPSALFGIANVLLIYILFSRFFTKSITFLLSTIFLTLHWYLTFVRYSFEMPFLLFLELTAIIFLFVYMKDKNMFYLAISALFSGLAYNSYQPGRIFIFLPLVYMLIQKISLRHILMYFFVFCFVIAPVSLYLMKNSTDDIRIGQQLYFNNPSLTVQQKIGYFMENVGKTVLMFSFKGDLNGRHNYPGKPALNPILGIILYSGIIFAISRIRKRPESLFFLIYFLIALVPTLFTYPIENPHMLRTFTVLPALIYFIGISLRFVLSMKIARSRIYYVFAGVIFLIAISTYYELRTYFVYQAQVFPYAFEMKGELKNLLQSD